MRSFFISAGEASGDFHGGALARALREVDPEVRLRGIGGKHMAEAGVELIADIRRLNVMGIVELLPRMREIIGIFGQAKDEIAAMRPDALIVIDFPEFNLRLADAVHKTGVRTVYHIPPKLWAWREGRIGKLRRVTDQVTVIFPFEEQFYAGHGVKAEYVGNPLIEDIRKRARPNPSGRPVVGLVPGSRRREIETLLPPMLDAVRALRLNVPDVRFVLPVAPSVDRRMLLEAVKLGVELHDRPLTEVVAGCDFAWVASGTAALETALVEVPMVVAYKVNPISLAVARRLVKLSHFSLPNILAGREVVPELLQNDVNGERLAAEALRILRDDEARRAVHADLRGVRRSLGKPGAARRAAEAIYRELEKQS